MSPEHPRTLIVDDVALIRNGLARILADAGCEIVGLARDGREGVALAQQLRPELILLDIVMPVMQGFEALPLLRQCLPEACIIILTSTSEKGLAYECKAKGADDFILKQGDLQQFLGERVRRRWQRHEARRS